MAIKGRTAPTPKPDAVGVAAAGAGCASPRGGRTMPKTGCDRCVVSPPSPPDGSLFISGARAAP